MAVLTTRIDDLTGDADASPVVITVNGRGVEVDLSAKSVGALTKLLAPYWQVGTESAYDVERRGFGKRRVAGPPDSKTVRAWAEANAVAVPSRGKIPQAVVDQYLRS